MGGRSDQTGPGEVLESIAFSDGSVLEVRDTSGRDPGARRLSLAVLDPLRVVITDLAPDHVEDVHARVFPGRTEDTYHVPLTRVVYIERSDFFFTADEPPKGWKGLAPGRTVALRYARCIACTGFVSDGDGVREVHATLSSAKPSGVLNWVAQPRPGVDPPSFVARLYGPLFRANPTDDDDCLADLDPRSCITTEGFATPVLAAAPPGSRFQLERQGYFCVDPSSTPGRQVLNRTCTMAAAR